jgi:Ca-activated chloride channel family protein
MTFLAPSHLWFLLVIAGLAAAYVALQIRRRHYAVRFANLELLESVAPRRPGWRRHVAAAAVGLALVAFIVSLARPVRAELVPRKQAIVMLVLDTSASMEATDVSPSRIESAVAAAKSFIADVPDTFQIGLVTFNKTAQLVAAPTTDHETVIAALDTVTTAPGTAAGEGIYTALDAIDAAIAAANGDATTASSSATAAKKVSTIVLLSDGETDVGRSVTDAAQAAADANVPVTTIAYGTDQGTITLDGKTVSVPSDPAQMQAVADTSGGTAFQASSASELSSVYSDIQGRVGYHHEQREILRWFVGVGVIALIAAAGASMVWSGRFL